MLIFTDLFIEITCIILFILNICVLCVGVELKPPAKAQKTARKKINKGDCDQLFPLAIAMFTYKACCRYFLHTLCKLSKSYIQIIML